MIPFKFFKGKVYTDEFTLPLTRRMSGRTIAQDLITTVPQTARIPNYDAKVINIVRRCMRDVLIWRGYETNVSVPGGYSLLKIVSGINIGGMFQILYLITRDGNTESYNVSVPLVNLQRRG